MSRINSILCAVDFSSASRRAATEAIRFAEQLGATSVVFLHAFEPESHPTSDGPVSESVEAAQRQARGHLSAFLGELPPTTISTDASAVAGDAVESILAAADEGGADVLVVGTTGRTGLRRAVIGSVAEGVARRSKVPVIVVRELSEEEPL